MHVSDCQNRFLYFSFSPRGLLDPRFVIYTEDSTFLKLKGMCAIADEVKPVCIHFFGHETVAIEGF